MQSKTLIKTVRQYSAGVVPTEVMDKLLTIASDYRFVKNYVYKRYGGIKSLAKLYPGYAVQNEMTKDGLRKRLGLPGAYFYPAIFEALTNIRDSWGKVKKRIGRRVRQNESFTEADRHYLRFILSIDKAFDAVLNRRTIELPAKMQKRYGELVALVNVGRLNNYIRRQTRKLHITLNTDNHTHFSTTIDGYRYGNHGIYLATKEYRQRLFIPLTDNNSYSHQLDIRLLPDESKVEIQAPIEVRVQQHDDYLAEVGLAMGMKVMLTTDAGHTYGEEIEMYHHAYDNWFREEHRKYQVNCAANPGRKKYTTEKNRREERLHSYINRELNRFLQNEKPAVVFLMKFPQGNKRYGDKSTGYAVHRWQRGYIRQQLMLKCRQHSVEVVEVFGKDIAKECSRCGGMGKREGDEFICVCGYRAPVKQNVAANVKKRGLTKK